MSRDSLQSVVVTFSCHSCHSQNLLLVDLRDFFSRFRVDETKKRSENDQLTGQLTDHFQSFIISPKQTLKLVR